MPTSNGLIIQEGQYTIADTNNRVAAQIPSVIGLRVLQTATIVTITYGNEKNINGGDTALNGVTLATGAETWRPITQLQLSSGIVELIYAK